MSPSGLYSNSNSLSLIYPFNSLTRRVLSMSKRSERCVASIRTIKDKYNPYALYLNFRLTSPQIFLKNTLIVEISWNCSSNVANKVLKSAELKLWKSGLNSRLLSLPTIATNLSLAVIFLNWSLGHTINRETT
ncbi:hypothetical protein WICPIJ_008776 [Wickerhamomyces pijperi]|uniref:Uncharacterized protein n=1 Tax=Wickerhamomyces pijperi TaxID=599730 RepID=A0A9P8PWK0_WICPI|nr:hypothetical protein WICPIJ_008776 [Wickerhamomyces pijperi]